MGDQIQPIRGMNDVLPDSRAAWATVENAAKDIFEAYGYKRIRIPALERTELFSRSIGETTDIVQKEMYTFEDRNGSSITLRPEATAGIVRAGLNNGLFHNKQQKLWCSGPMFRYEKPQKARYRQFNQIDVEAIGFPGPEVDAELITMSAQLWGRLGLESPRLMLNSLGTPEARAVYREALKDYFSEVIDSLDPESLNRLERNPLRILDSKNPDLVDLILNAPELSDYLDDDSKFHFDNLLKMLDSVNIDYEVNSRLVRGLDYYSRTVFEWVTDKLGAQSAVCSGGRYDGLVSQLGGRETPAIGWALGVERVVELLDAEQLTVTEQLPEAYLVAEGEYPRSLLLRVSEELREKLPNACISMDCMGGSLKAQLRRADRSGARFALILGMDELNEGKVSVKALREDTPQVMLNMYDLASMLLGQLEKSP
ncbi:MAG: histidine--tRNA ligase [Rhodospirillaceae bacterium]|mgnify:CR=1 FL=1|nr:histidine--tRNA ligase [Rhodospirillaceae bacterium]